MALQLPIRPKTGHKGTFGTVAIFGGHISDQEMMLGSPAFSAKAALRTGVGMVVFIGQERLLADLIKLVPQAVGIIPTKNLSDFSEKWQALIIGPGLGQSPDNIKIIQELLSLKLPTIIDADGINILATHPELSKYIHNLCVLTPHPKEFERIKISLEINSPDEAATELGCTVVLKSHQTYITDGEINWTYNKSNPALAAAGTGDVLAGLIGGLMAQYSVKRLSVFECAQLGVIIHTKAAERWQKTHGSGGLIIDELLELIPKVMQDLRQK